MTPRPAGEIVCLDRWLVGVPVGEPSVSLGKVGASRRHE